MTILINHNLFLTKKQRYNLHNKEKIEIVGSSIPIIILDKKDKLEQEVFCKYTLTNEPTYEKVVANEYGYEINIPQLIKSKSKLKLSSLKNKYSSKSLLDIVDGGCEWMQFKCYNKLKNDLQTFNIIHYVEIKPIETLINNMISNNYVS